MPSTTTGGTELTALKKLNGAALTRPEPSTVVASAIGRGTTVLMSSLWASVAGICARSICILASAVDRPLTHSTHGQRQVSWNCHCPVARLLHCSTVAAVRQQGLGHGWRRVRL